MSSHVAPISSSENKSTNVRKTISPADGGLALALRLLERVSSGLAGRAVARAFFTTYRPPVRDDDAAHLARGERVAIPYGRARLAGWSFGDGPAILLSHGWCGRAAQLAPIASALADAGFRALVFDHPGHGESSGRSATIPDMAFALAEADAFVGGAHAVVAHSMGAVVATLASSRTIRPRRLAYLAPPVVPERWLSAFTEKLGLGPAVLPSMRRAVEARAGIPITALDPLPIARASATPLLVVHDRSDREVPFAAGEALAQAWPGAELVATDGLGHYRLLRQPEIAARVARFMAPLLA